MAYRLEILKAAKDELAKELAYSRQRWGKEHAKAYGRELRDQIRSLKQYPEVHPLRNDILEGIRIKPYKGNQIVYTVLEDQQRVVVLAVLSVYQTVDPNRMGRRQSGFDPENK